MSAKLKINLSERLIYYMNELKTTKNTYLYVQLLVVTSLYKDNEDIDIFNNNRTQVPYFEKYFTIVILSCF
jgi:hypothetical protein